MAFQAITATLTAYSYGQQRRATKAAAAAEEKRFAITEQKAEVQNVRSFRQAIRQQRLAQGAMMNVAAQTGGMGGSGIAGGMASAGSQTASTLGYMSEVAQYNTQIGQATVQASKSLADAALYQQVGDIGMTIFGQTGGYQKIFKT